MASNDASYIDYESFLSPSFSPSAFANTLVLSTNNASDSSLDLSTPLSKTLFDLQEVDTHIHNVTTQSALPLLTHAQSQNEAAARLSSSFSDQIGSLVRHYSRLESEVVGRHAAAEQVRLCAARLWVTLRIGRAVSRALALGRRLDMQMAEVKPNLNPGAGTRKGDDHRAMLSATYTILDLRALLAADGSGMEGEHLSRIASIEVLRRDLVEPSESRLRGKAQQIVREFAPANAKGGQSITESGTQRDTRTLSPTGTAQLVAQTYSQATEMMSRTTSALITLYLLSPISSTRNAAYFAPSLLLTALQTYLQTSLTSSTASLSRALAQLPQLPRALQETAARCGNITALESLLQATPVPQHPLLVGDQSNDGFSTNAGGEADGAAEEVADLVENGSKANWSLLRPLLLALDTASLTSFFWRSLASSMSSKVAEIISRGGAPARSLRGQKERIREMVRDAVLRGCEGARQSDGRSGKEAWEREAAVMVASITGQIG